jgi:hypothetical protein
MSWKVLLVISALLVVAVFYWSPGTLRAMFAGVIR